jgi:hypothetical protein
VFARKSGIKLDPTEFRRILLDPAAWEQTADALLFAAQPMRGSVQDLSREFRANRFPDYLQWQTVQVYFMLCAYALENLFKARIVQVQRPAIEERLRANPDDLPNLLASHDLVDLAVKAGMQHFAEEERFFLKKLSAASVWYGRYPLPRSTADFGSAGGVASEDPAWIDSAVDNIKVEIRRGQATTSAGERKHVDEPRAAE